jgi:ribose transport system substrate-binding protein
LVAVLGPGCTKNDQNSSTTDNKKTDGPSPKDNTGGPNKNTGPAPKVAFVTNNPAAFWTIAQRGTEKAAKDYSADVTFKRPASGNAAEQQRIIEDLLTTGIQGVAISPNDAANLEGFLKTDVASKVPLICVDSDVPDTTARRCYLGTHNYRAGRAAGALVEKAAPQGGRFVIFVGKMDVQNAIERRQGVLDYLAGKKQQELGKTDPANATNLKVGKYILVETKTDGAKENVCQERAEDVLSRETDLVCLVGLWEYNPPALLRAVRGSKNATKPAIVGFDENYDTLEGVRSGEIIGTVVQDPFGFGYEAVKILSHMVRDGDDRILKSYKDLDNLNRIVIPHRVITKEAGTLPETNGTLPVDPFYAELKKLKGDVQ